MYLLPSASADGQAIFRKRVALATFDVFKFILKEGRKLLKTGQTSFFNNRKLNNCDLMSWARIWIHMVSCTKNRMPYLQTKDNRRKMFQHIKTNAQTKNIWLDSVNGYKEHAHCLISLGKEQNVSKVAQLIKGESSFWINRSGILNRKFTWQDDYWAVSVSESHLESVRTYIHSQEGHHRKVSFKEEIDEFMKKYDCEKLKE